MRGKLHKFISCCRQSGATFQAFKVSDKKLLFMKSLFCIVIAYTLTLTACTKSITTDSSITTDPLSATQKALQDDNGCIERIIISATAHSIHVADIATVNNLFSSNGIDNSKFRYYWYVHDTFQTRYPPYTKYDEQAVRVDQYANGARIFTGDLVYTFWNNSFHYRGGNLTNGTSLDTVPKLSLGQIRKLFLNNIEQYDHAANKFKDSCFKAEFGYFNLNAGISYSQEVLVKAWRVTPKNSFFPSEYPVAFYQDNDGKPISYDNGIRTFK